jgi:monoamine oxidase
LVQHFGLNERQVEALTVYMQDLANYSSLMPQYNIPILVGYATNRAAELMERLSDEEARMVYLCQMAHYFPILLQEEGTGKEGELVGKALWPTVSFMSRWNQDPFARGSYTSIPIGASQMDLEVFGIPVGARSYGTLCGNSDDEDNSGLEEKVEGEEKLRLKSVDDAENGRIFFAGEHTSPGRFASVHGALMTGQREAAKILGQHSF